MSLNRIPSCHSHRSMKYRIAGFIGIWLIFIGLGTSQTQAAETQISLLLDKTEAKPGGSVLAGVRFKLKVDWHTYWRYGGDAAQPPSITWNLPAGVTAGEIRWPLPHKEVSSGLYSYAYHDEVVLLVPLTLNSDLKTGPLTLNADIFWLECKESCVPRDGKTSATLQIGAADKTSPDAASLAEWNSKVPPTAVDLKIKADWSKNVAEDERQLTFELAKDQGFYFKDFYPFESEAFEIGGKTELGQPEGKPLSLTKTLLNWEESWPKKIGGVALLAKEADGTTQALEISVTLGKDFEAGNGETTATAVSPKDDGTEGAGTTSPKKSSAGWPLMLVFAFVGGFILNFMPCVLPVISLKILGFVHQSKEEPKRIFQLGLLYGVGVLFSFWILAGLVIGVQSAGNLANWGMQFQNPQFLVLMTLLVTLVALNFFGVFEITGGRLTNVASAAASREGNMGAFFNGILATVLATPCTAPFLGTALGFAFTQPPIGIVILFTTVALGLAFPYILLSWNPAWLGILPKPGAWMERFKVFMGFPMIGTAIWLYTIARLHFGEKGDLWMGLLLVFVAMAAWVYGEFVQRGSSRKGLALGVSAACLLFAYGWILEKELNWRDPVGPVTAGAGKATQGKNGILWQPWTEEAVAKAREEGKVVLVDFTAKWCANCQINKKTSIEINSVREKLENINGVTFKGDYTFYDSRITTQLQKFGRSGVPLVLIYSPNTEEPILLPELLTPGIVLDALDKASAKS